MYICIIILWANDLLVSKIMLIKLAIIDRFILFSPIKKSQQEENFLSKNYYYYYTNVYNFNTYYSFVIYRILVVANCLRFMFVKFKFLCFAYNYFSFFFLLILILLINKYIYIYIFLFDHDFTYLIFIIQLFTLCCFFFFSRFNFFF
jgi:hypothetical protein